MKTIDVPQLSVEWFEARRGRPTASEFHRIITAKKGEYAAAARGYLCELVAEKYHRGELPSFGPSPMTPAMGHGITCEPQARSWYALWCGQDIEQVGHCLTDDGRFGCSPDGLVGEDGVLELKCPQEATHVRYLLWPELLEEEYRSQCHGHLIVTGRQRVDLVSYCPGWPAVIRRIEPDEFTEATRGCLDRFHGELTGACAIMDRIMSEGGK